MSNEYLIFKTKDGERIRVDVYKNFFQISKDISGGQARIMGKNIVKNCSELIPFITKYKSDGCTNGESRQLFERKNKNDKKCSKYGFKKGYLEEAVDIKMFADDIMVAVMETFKGIEVIDCG